MTNIRFILCLCLVIALLTSCAPDPRREADAFATQSEAEQLTKDAEQQRANEQELHNEKMQNLEASQTELQNAINQLIRSGTLFAEFTLMLLILGAGVSGVWMMLGTSKAYVIWAENKANQIPLNPTTRQFPLFKYVGKGFVSLTNPNDNSTLLLDTRNEPDRAKIIAMANVQHSGALAHEARLSHRPGEVAQIPAAQIIDHVESE